MNDSYINERYLVQLIRSIILSEQPLERPEEVSFGKIFKIAKAHNIANMAYYAIVKLKSKPNEDLLKLWKQENRIGIMRDIIQKNEFSVIVEEFKKNSINHLPLKGFDLKKVYPKSDMRDMSDLDILILEKDREKIKEILKELGYSVIHYGRGKDDIYHKKPVMNLEMHNSLLPEYMKEKYPYIAKLGKMESCIKKDDYSYRFSLEDSLIYGIVHVAKHFKISGTGIKSVTDWYLYQKKNGDRINWNYVEIQLKELKLYEFYTCFMDLGKTWFEGLEYSDLIREMESYIFNSGVYGNEDTRVLNTVAENSKETGIIDRIKTILKMAFPNYLVMCDQYPRLKNRKELLCFYYVKRIFEIIFFRRKNKLNIIKTVLLKDKVEVQKRREFYRKIGLEK